MIDTVADLLLQLKEHESARLGGMPIKHAPTIGDMYEGLSRDLLERAVPRGIQLSVSQGFIVDGAGRMSGQIDCMLVRGTGEEVPYTSSKMWHIKDVLAVFEIKKTLYSKELGDAFSHLQEVKEIEYNWFKTGDGFYDLAAGVKAFEQTTGRLAPPPAELGSTLAPLDFLIYHSLIKEEMTVTRIIFGYNGFRSESKFREAMNELMRKNLGTRGFGFSGMPELVVSGGYSIVKANGQPFISPKIGDKWPFCFSAKTNPLRLMLEFIWTRLEREYSIGNLWGEDLKVENFHPYMFAEAGESEGQIGWIFSYRQTSDEELDGLPEYREWRPVELSIGQAVALQLLAEDGEPMPAKDPRLAAIAANEDSMPTLDAFIADLVATRLVATDGDQIDLLTEELALVALPSGQIVGAENNTGKLTRWMIANGHREE